MSNNIPVNGWPQLKDLEAVQPTLDRLDKIESWKRTVKEETFTGEEITIPNALALPARSLITEINAIQDLHGYDKPWAGGADVNKFDISSATMAGYISVFGLTVAKDSDGYITITGTYTGESGVPKFAIIPTLPLLDNAVFYLMDKNTDANNNVIQCRWSNPSTGGVAIDLQNMVQNQTYNIKFRLMIVTDGTVPTSYRPYSNICPMSGRTAAVITRSDGDEISEDFTIQLGTTVYGADINWDMGVMTVRTAAETFDGSNDENWELSGSGKRVYTNNLASVIKAPASGEIVANIISNEFKATSGNNTYAGNIGVSVDTTGLLGVSDGMGSMSPSAFKTWLTSNPLQVEYELATPIELTLTPVAVQMLKGYNRVTLSDGYGTIELKALTGANWS